MASALTIEQMKLHPKPPRRRPAAHYVGAALVLVAVAVGGGLVGALIQSSASSSSSSCGADSPALFDASAGVTVAPSQMPLPEASSTLMKRSRCSYSGTVRANYSQCIGVNTILDAEDGSTELYHVRTEVVTDAPFGEFASATAPSVYDGRSFRLVINDLRTGELLIIVPFGLSEGALLANLTTSLQPNFFFLQYVPAPLSRRRLEYGADAKAAGGFSTFASTLPGKLVAEKQGYQADVDKKVNPLLYKYWLAAIKDAKETGKWPPKNSYNKAAYYAKRSLRRALGLFHSIGHWAGSKVGTDVGQDVGKSVGGDVGEWVGGAAGAAVAGPVGADVGAFAGREIGSWAGSHLGGDVGGHIGGDAGGGFGSWLGGF